MLGGKICPIRSTPHKLHRKLQHVNVGSTNIVALGRTATTETSILALFRHVKVGRLAEKPAGGGSGGGGTSMYWREKWRKYVPE